MLKRILFALIVLFSASLVIAQVENPPVAGIDWFAVGSQAIMGLTPVVVFLLVQGVKAVSKKLPNWAPPIIALALGAVANVVAQMAASPKNAILGAIFGLAATGIYEIQKNLRG